jgi:hypothetical protein
MTIKNQFQSFLFILAIISPSLVRAADYAIKTDKAAPPKQLADEVAKELSGTSIQFTQDGDTVCTVWFCTSVPSIGTPAQAKNGLTYQEIKQGTLIGAIEIVRAGFQDYRKQKLPTGVYTLRLGFQPMDGDHMGTAPNREFLLLSPADADKKVDAIDDGKALAELSAKTTKSGHPAVLLLFPSKPASPPELVQQKEPPNHWTINAQTDAVVEKKSYPMGISLTVVGQTS